MRGLATAWRNAASRRNGGLPADGGARRRRRLPARLHPLSDTPRPRNAGAPKRECALIAILRQCGGPATTAPSRPPLSAAVLGASYVTAADASQACPIGDGVPHD